MHRSPRLVRAEALAVDAAEVMEQHRITSVLVVDAPACWWVRSIPTT
jgi:arabinose-5-phosphate isomerase